MDVAPTPPAPGPEPTPTPAPVPEPQAAPEAPALDLDAVTADLAGVEAALQRLDDGTYGRCLACQAEIGDDVLAGEPTQATCAAHLPV